GRRVQGGSGGEYPRARSPTVRPVRTGPGSAALARPGRERPPALVRVRWRYTLSVSPLVWALTITGILAVIAADLFLIHRNDTREFTTRRAAFWSSIYVGLAVLFGIGVWVFSGARYAGEYFGGFVTEKSLSVDNLFVFMVILTRFDVPKHVQHAVLMAGIVIALVLRGVFIAVGAAAISAFTWVFFLFGAFLIWTAFG